MGVCVVINNAFKREKEGQEKPMTSAGKKREDHLAFSFFLLLPLPPPRLISVVERERKSRSVVIDWTKD